MNMNTSERDNEYIAGTYGRFPLEIESGKGSITSLPSFTVEVV